MCVKQMSSYKVLLVAGGLGLGKTLLSSTEQLDGESASWKTVTPLPRAVYGVVGITLNNMVFMTGRFLAANI